MPLDTCQTLLDRKWRAACHSYKNHWPGTDWPIAGLLRPHAAEMLRIAALCEGHADEGGTAFEYVFETLQAWNEAAPLTGLAGFGAALATFFPLAKAHPQTTAIRFFEKVGSRIKKSGGKAMFGAEAPPGVATEVTALPEGAAEWLDSFPWGGPDGDDRIKAVLEPGRGDGKTPAERFDSMRNLLSSRAERWGAAQTAALKAILAFGTSQAKNHMDNKEDLLFDMSGEKKRATVKFWEAVAHFVIEMIEARRQHKQVAPEIDKCFQDRVAQLLVDGIGVNAHILHVTRDNMKMVHDMYWKKHYVTSGPTLRDPGPWMYADFKDWTGPGGWEMALR
jgi:hypothetical protein